MKNTLMFHIDVLVILIGQNESRGHTFWMSYYYYYYYLHHASHKAQSAYNQIKKQL